MIKIDWFRLLRENCIFGFWIARKDPLWDMNDGVIVKWEPKWTPHFGVQWRSFKNVKTVGGQKIPWHRCWKIRSPGD